MRKLILLSVLILNCKIETQECIYDAYQGGKVFGTQINYRDSCEDTYQAYSVFYFLKSQKTIINGYKNDDYFMELK